MHKTAIASKTAVFVIQIESTCARSGSVNVLFCPSGSRTGVPAGDLLAIVLLAESGMKLNLKIR
jgi:hypothetical protein